MRMGMGPPGPGTVRFSVLPTGTSFGPTSCIRPTKISRAATGPASDILGPGTAGIWSRKPFTNGSSGIKLQIPRIIECEFGQNRQASASSVKGDLPGGIEAAFDDVVEEYAHGQPEPRAIDGPFRLKGDDRAARIVHGRRAMLFGKIGGDAVQVVCAKVHERIPERAIRPRSGNRRVNAH